MSSHPTTGKPPPAPPSSSGPSKTKSAGFHHSGFVSRYKLQQQRIRTLNQLDSSSEAKKKTHKTLPKIENGPDKENLVVRAVQRSNTIDAVKLPGVKGGKQPGAPQNPPPSHKRKTLPVKNFHFRVNPEHTSFISKSLPSLPSIPGSPSYPEDQAVSPLTDRPHHRDRVKLPVFPSKHRFENIVFQKHLHRDPTDMVKSAQTEQTKQDTRVTTSYLPPTFKTDQGHHVPADLHRGARGQEKPHTSGSIRLRYSKVPSEVVISETQSEPSFEVSRKWKENCRCLRCQMLKRQFQEGDTQYSMWGRYPCHNVDPSVMLDD